VGGWRLSVAAVSPGEPVKNIFDNAISSVVSADENIAGCAYATNSSIFGLPMRSAKCTGCGSRLMCHIPVSYH
jgi:hypothetical protein